MSLLRIPWELVNSSAQLSRKTTYEIIHNYSSNALRTYRTRSSNFQCEFMLSVDLDLWTTERAINPNCPSQMRSEAANFTNVYKNKAEHQSRRFLKLNLLVCFLLTLLFRNNGNWREFMK